MEARGNHDWSEDRQSRVMGFLLLFSCVCVCERERESERVSLDSELNHQEISF